MRSALVTLVCGFSHTLTFYVAVSLPLYAGSAPLCFAAGGSWLCVYCRKAVGGEQHVTGWQQTVAAAC